MASALSFAAIHRIIDLVENDDRPSEQKKKKKTKKRRIPRSSLFEPHLVGNRWCTVYVLYRDVQPSPPRDYLHSLEMALVYKAEVDDEDVSAIFAHQKPLEFWGCPRLLVSKIVEAFGKMQKEPAYLDVTITALDDFGATMPSEAWSQVYRNHMPCSACTTVQTVQRRSIPRPRELFKSGSVRMAVEKFHIASESFGKRLTVELHYALVDREEDEEGMSESDQKKSSVVHRIKIRMGSENCAAKGRLPAIADRSRPTRMLVSDVACGVYGFLDRAHIGSSLLANGALHDVICQLNKVLPVHHLKCGFVERVFSVGDRWWLTCWLMIRHLQRDLSYADVRCFEVPSTADAVNDCAMIRRYLSNSHVDDLMAIPAFFRFATKMLASLAERNFSIGRPELHVRNDRLSDYRSMDAVFGVTRMSELHLSCDEHRFVELVKTTDFFRMSTIQGLRRLDLFLSAPRTGEEKPRSDAVSKNPIWLSGIHLLRNCGYYRVAYEVENAIRGARRLRRIERSAVRICEAFERGEITDTVEHFRFGSNSKANCVFSPAFSRDNLLVSGMIVEGPTHQPGLSYFEWDVYRFRNANTGEYLTACVGRHIDNVQNELHIQKGEVYPNASFAS